MRMQTRNRGLSRRTAAAPPPTGERTLLQTSDFTYLGRWYFPGTLTGEFHFGLGHFAAKYVGGNLRFYSKGAAGGINHTYSFENPGINNTATIITSYHNDEIYGNPSKLLKADAGDNVEFCSFFFDSAGVLWTTYSTEYEGTNHNPCLMASVLSEAAGTGTATTYGPWRCSLHSGMSAGCLSAVPSWVRSTHTFDPIINVSGMRVQNGVSSWGMSIQSLTLPSLVSTPDPVNNQSISSITSRLLAHHPIGNKEPRVTTFDICDGYTSAPAYAASNVWGGDGQILDWVDQGIWIDNGTKHGIVGMGQWCAAIPGFDYPGSDTRPHNWYGPDTCAHGHVATPLYQGTGPACSSVVDMLYISDPMNAIAVKNGLMAATDNNITYNAQLPEITNYPFSAKRDTLDKVGGMFFDSTTNLLYVSFKLSYSNAIGHTVPFMAVFSVAT
jgi:hypothetical protein